MTAKERINKAFIEAGIAFYLGGDWKGIVRRAAREAVGKTKPAFNRLMGADESKFDRIIHIFVREMGYE